MHWFCKHILYLLFGNISYELTCYDVCRQKFSNIIINYFKKVLETSKTEIKIE